MLHKARELLVRQKTMLTNAIRAHLAEFGLVAAQGPGGLSALLVVFDAHREQLPRLACAALDGLIAQADHIATEIAALEARILEWHRGHATSKRLATIPGVGPLTASAIAARPRRFTVPFRATVPCLARPGAESAFEQGP